MAEEKEDAEHKDAQRLSAPGGKVVYKAILKEGEEELARSSSALFWSGLAAGLSMGFSMIAEGLLHAYLPDTYWRPLVAKFGYSAGFLIVILGRAAVVYGEHAHTHSAAPSTQSSRHIGQRPTPLGYCTNREPHRRADSCLGRCSNQC